MSTDLEQLLRATLDHRGAAITSGPQWRPPANPRRPRVQLRWYGALAAAAAVLAVALILVLLPGSHPAHPGSHQSSTMSVVPPPAPRQLHGATCTTGLPTAWSRAIDTGRLPASAGTLTPLATTTGGVLAARNDQLVRIGPNGSESVVYTAPDSLGITLAASSSHWILVARTQSGGDPYAIDVVDTASHRVLHVRTATTRTEAVVQAPVLSGDSVYWSEGTQFGIGSVYEYDLVHHRTRTLDHGYVSPVVAAGGGVYWLKSSSAGSKSGRLVTHIEGTLPPGYAIAPYSAYAALQRDGAISAWGHYVGDRYEFRAWRPGSRPVTLFPPGQAGAGETPAVAGSYVFARSRVVDVSTGASARLPDDVVLTGHGLLVVQTGNRLSVVRTEQLPALHC